MRDNSKSTKVLLSLLVVTAVSAAAVALVNRDKEPPIKTIKIEEVNRLGLTIDEAVIITGDSFKEESYVNWRFDIDEPSLKLEKLSTYSVEVMATAVFDGEVTLIASNYIQTTVHSIKLYVSIDAQAITLDTDHIVF